MWFLGINDKYVCFKISLQLRWFYLFLNYIFMQHGCSCRQRLFLGHGFLLIICLLCGKNFFFSILSFFVFFSLFFPLFYFCVAINLVLNGALFHHAIRCVVLLVTDWRHVFAAGARSWFSPRSEPFLTSSTMKPGRSGAREQSTKSDHLTRGWFFNWQVWSLVHRRPGEEEVCVKLSLHPTPCSDVGRDSRQLRFHLR